MLEPIRHDLAQVRLSHSNRLEMRYYWFMGIPKDNPTRFGWASGILVSALTVFWWFDSLDGSVFETMPIKILAAIVTCAIGAYLMLINYD
jgi:hypothetical protein